MNKLYNKILKYYFLYNLFVIASITTVEIILFFVKSNFLIIFILSIALFVAITDRLYWYFFSRRLSFIKLQHNENTDDNYDS